MSPASTPSRSAPSGTFPPLLIIAAGCVCAMLTFGPRSSMGLMTIPVTTEFGYGRDVYGLALAIQNLMWGIGTPFAGAIADRFGTVRVLSVGALIYAAGLALMVVSPSPMALYLSAGVLMGLGLAGCSFNIVIAAFGKLLPPENRSLAFGAGSAAGSFGQFLFAPLTLALIDLATWQGTSLFYAVMMLAILPLSMALVTPRALSAPTGAPQAGQAPMSIKGALAEAFGHRSYILLVLGFFTCGFQLAFITIHLPPYIKDVGLPPWVAATTLMLIGLFNIVGSLTAGWLGNHMPRRYILSIIYFARSLAIIALMLLPSSPALMLIFGAVMGLLWLSTVPPTSSLVMLMFGTRYMAMLYGFAFFSHQVGGFLGAWLGGVLYERLGSYDIVWWGSVVLGLVSALINMPIVEQPVNRAAPVPAAA
jgi:MFS family permease